MPVTVTGASDDLIEVGGDIEEEFNAMLDPDESRILAFSDGTLLRIRYDRDGIWRITRINNGAAQFSKVEGSVSEDTFDVVTLSGVLIEWVAIGNDHAVNKKVKSA